MLFNSYIFLLFFLPFTWCIYYILNHFKCYRFAQGALVAASFVFYGYEDYHLCFILLGTILVNYLFHYLFLEKIKSSWLRKGLLITGICANFGLLFYFKYFNFLLENLNRFAGGDFTMKNIVMPLGISFFTFQQVSFVVDSYKWEVERVDFLDYALFVSFFPQLVAGPIVLHGEMIPQFRDTSKKKIQFDSLIAGLEYLIIGFAKKVLIADQFARICDAGYAALAELNSISAVLTMLAFTLQIYFDFSGYCDMAIGLGKLFNIEIPLNFDSPYRSFTIAEFWKRWHMTLTRFLTTYLYIPLGGNRKGTARTIFNLFIVWFMTGLWHGINWNFLVWGLGLWLIIVLEKCVYRKFLERHRFIGHLYVIAIIPVMWFVFAMTDWNDFLTYLSRLFPVKGNWMGVFTRDYIKYLSLYGGYFAAGLLLCTRLPEKIWHKIKNNFFGVIILLAIFAAAVYCMYLGLNDPFLYFRF